MTVLRDLPRPPFPPYPVVTVGNFDGQHIGHRHLLASVVRCARERGGTPMALTFDPHPAAVLRPGAAVQLLTSQEDKEAWFAAQGVARLVVLRFTAAFAALRPAEFVDAIVRDGLGAKAVVVGERFVFGKDRAGTVETLRDLAGRAQIQVHVVPPVCAEGAVVSSTRIRRLVRHGQMEQARQCLGRPYALHGTVVEGEGRGRTLGCRTANLRLPPGRVIPADGVYAAKMVWRDRAWPAVSYLGTRPTFGAGERVLETHVLDAACPSLYGEGITVQVLRYLRGDAVFEDAGRLAARIAQDVQLARDACAD